MNQEKENTRDNVRQTGHRSDCWKCLHHYITHDPRFPYACRAMQFKSRKLPCLEVLEASGEPCLMFQRKGG
jgi:hypothetical protein